MIESPLKPKKPSIKQGLAETLLNTGKVKQIIIDGLSLEYWHLQRGHKTVVFIHGNSAGKEVFYEQFKYFADHNYSLLAIDLPGHGGSADAKKPLETYTIPAYARIIQQVLEQLNVNTTSLVGWSLGGHIAIEMVGAGFPANSIFITGTPPMGPGLDDFLAAFLPTPSGAVTTSAEASVEAIHAYTADLYGSLSPIPEHFYTLAERTDGRARARMGEHWASATEGHNQPSIASTWNAPLGVGHGTLDQFISRDYLYALKWANLWNGQIQEFTESGHAPFLEEPKNFNALLHQFLVETL